MNEHPRGRKGKTYDQPHGVAGQLNIYMLDVDSIVTSYGRHNRLVTCMCEGKIVVSESDIGLEWATERDVRRVACFHTERLHARRARLIYEGGERYQSDRGLAMCEHTFKIVPQMRHSLR